MPTPGYWIECSRAISSGSDAGGSALTEAGESSSALLHDPLQEVQEDEGVANSPDGSLREDQTESIITDMDTEKDSLLSTPR